MLAGIPSTPCLKQVRSNGSTYAVPLYPSTYAAVPHMSYATVPRQCDADHDYTVANTAAPRCRPLQALL
jgi:hypothetical protein